MTDKEIERLRQIINFETGLTLRQADEVERELRDYCEDDRNVHHGHSRRRAFPALTSATILQFRRPRS
jgi:hypothetical protein